MNDFEKMIQAKPEVAVETIANQLMEIEQLQADLKDMTTNRDKHRFANEQLQAENKR